MLVGSVRKQSAHHAVRARGVKLARKKRTANALNERFTEGIRSLLTGLWDEAKYPTFNQEQQAPARTRG